MKETAVHVVPLSVLCSRTTAPPPVPAIAPGATRNTPWKVSELPITTSGTGTGCTVVVVQLAETVGLPGMVMPVVDPVLYPACASSADAAAGSYGSGLSPA